MQKRGAREIKLFGQGLGQRRAVKATIPRQERAEYLAHLQLAIASVEGSLGLFAGTNECFACLTREVGGLAPTKTCKAYVKRPDARKERRLASLGRLFGGVTKSWDDAGLAAPSRHRSEVDGPIHASSILQPHRGVWMGRSTAQQYEENHKVLVTR